MRSILCFVRKRNRLESMKAENVLYTQMTKIRIATKNDLETLLEFEQKLIAHERPHDSTLKQTGKIHYYDLPMLMESDNSEVFVADLKGEIAGTGYGVIEDNKSKYAEPKYGYIGFIVVKDEFRRQGIGDKILKHLLKWFKERDVFEAMLKVYDTNEGAVNLYEKLGFEKGLVEMKINLREE